MKKIISTDLAPAAIGPYSQAIQYGNLLFVSGQIAINPETGEIDEWQNPSERSGPYAIAADDQDRVWFVETHPTPNNFVGFDPASETFFSVTPIPSGAGAVRHT